MLIILLTLNIVFLLLLLVLGLVAFHFAKTWAGNLFTQYEDIEKIVSDILNKESHLSLSVSEAKESIDSMREDQKRFNDGLAASAASQNKVNASMDNFFTGLGNLVNFNPYASKDEVKSDE